jgi:hypothetical protein
VADSTPESGGENKDGGGPDRQLELFEKTAQIAEKLEATTQQVASIAQTVADRPAPAAPAAPQQQIQHLSEEQVFAAIERGDITQAAGMAYLLKRAKEEAKAEGRREAQQTLVEVGRAASEHDIAGKIAAYRHAVPALGVRGSPEWNEVAARFHELVAEGHPRDSIRTELVALRDIFGRDPSKAGSDHAPVRERTKERVTRGESPSSASGRGSAPRRQRGNEPDSELPQDARDYVDKMIRIGQYKSWDDPRVAKYAERFKASAARRAARA